MKKMTPREALYYITIELGPAKTTRDDNITFKEARLRDAIRTLQDFVLKHSESTVVSNTDSDDYVPNPSKKQIRDGKDRIESWKEDWKKHIQ